MPWAKLKEVENIESCNRSHQLIRICELDQRFGDLVSHTHVALTFIQIPSFLKLASLPSTVIHSDTAAVNSHIGVGTMPSAPILLGQEYQGAAPTTNSPPILDSSTVNRAWSSPMTASPVSPHCRR